MAMQWEEVSRRLRNGTSVQILAELDNVPYKTMLERIKYHERKDGKKYITPDQLKKERKRKTKEPKEEPAPDPAPEKKEPEFLMKRLHLPEDKPENIPEAVYKPAPKISVTKTVIEDIQANINENRRLSKLFETEAKCWEAILEAVQEKAEISGGGADE